ncbi:MAG: hypothetical protein AAGF48_14725 [Pseudomonadota bacterium]
MKKVLLVCTTALMLAVAVSLPASASNMSRTWQHHFWVWEHADVHVSVFHLPNGNLRVSGRFSNGMKSVDRTISVTVLAETRDGAFWKMTVNERVPMTGFGGTQVRSKSQEMPVPDHIEKVYATASIVSDGQTFSISLKCKNEAEKCRLQPKYKEEARKLLKVSKEIPEGTPVNICAGFRSKTWVNWAAQTTNWQKCDPKSGNISEHSEVATRPLPQPSDRFGRTFLIP